MITNRGSYVIIRNRFWMTFPSETNIFIWKTLSRVNSHKVRHSKHKGVEGVSKIGDQFAELNRIYKRGYIKQDI